AVKLRNRHPYSLFVGMENLIVSDINAYMVDVLIAALGTAGGVEKDEVPFTKFGSVVNRLSIPLRLCPGSTVELDSVFLVHILGEAGAIELAALIVLRSQLVVRSHELFTELDNLIRFLFPLRLLALVLILTFVLILLGCLLGLILSRILLLIPGLLIIALLFRDL